jgi:signal peptide peptidase SppA
MNTLWMIEENALETVKQQSTMFAAQTPESRPQAQQAPLPAAPLATINVHGVIYTKEPWWAGILGGAVGMDSIRAQLNEALASPEVKAIAMNFDTPGGEVYGLHELANEVFEARGKKPIYSYIGRRAASAGMYLALAASEVYAESPMSHLGALGIIATHENHSKANENAGIEVTEVYAGTEKNLLSPNKPLSKEGKAILQARTDEFYSLMKNDVSRFRGVSEEHAHETFMDGKTFTGDKAVAIGLADAIASKADFEAKILRPLNSKQPIAKPRRGFMNLQELAAEQGGQALIDSIKAAATAEGKALGYAEGLEKGKADGIAEAVAAQPIAVKEAVAGERQRIQSILALLPSYSKELQGKITAMAYEEGKTDADALRMVHAWNADKTAAASEAVLAKTTPPIPGTGGQGDPATKAGGEMNAKEINAHVDAMLKENPDMTRLEAQRAVYNATHKEKE